MSDSIERRVRAVVSLLDDDAPDVARAALEALGPLATSHPEAVSAAVEAAAPGPRTIGRGVLAERSALLLRRRLALQARQLDDLRGLEEALLILAQLRYPLLDPAAVSRSLDALADALRPRLSGRGDEAARWEVVRAWFFDELGFSGNTQHYYAPENSYLNRVLETRRGIPLSLAQVLLLIGGRTGLPLTGIGYPGHFLLRVEAADGPGLLVDPFHEGRVLTESACADLERQLGIPFETRYVEPASPRAMLVRTLNNLIGVYLGLEDRERAADLAGVLAGLQAGEA